MPLSRRTGSMLYEVLQRHCSTASGRAPDAVAASKWVSLPHSFSGGREDVAHVSLVFLGLLLCYAALVWPGIRGLWWDSMGRKLIEEDAVPLAL